LNYLLLPPRPDEAERLRLEERLPPAPLFFDALRVRDERPTSCAVLRSMRRPRSLVVDCPWPPALRRVTPPRWRASFDELLRPFAIALLLSWRARRKSCLGAIDCKECA
jgi:hypothetical protein